MFLFFGTARTFVRRSKGIKDTSVFTFAERRRVADGEEKALISVTRRHVPHFLLHELDSDANRGAAAAPAVLPADAAPVFRAALPLGGPDVGKNATVKLQRPTVAGGENITASVGRRLAAAGFGGARLFRLSGATGGSRP